MDEPATTPKLLYLIYSRNVPMVWYRDKVEARVVTLPLIQANELEMV